MITNRLEVQTGGTIYFDRPGYYFGYGLEADHETFYEIIGRRATTELGVTAIGRQLAVQEIDQIPDTPVEAFGNRSPQAIIAEAWGKHTDMPFSSYTLQPSDNRGDLVDGTLYEIGMDEALRLMEWDLSTAMVYDDRTGRFVYPGWRFWDHGIELADGRRVMTLTTDNEQAVDRTVAGQGYDRFLNDPMVTGLVIDDFVAGLRS